MTRDEIISRINEIVIDVLADDPYRVLGQELTLADDLKMDYKKVDDLTRAIENSFGFLLAYTDYPRRQDLMTLSDVYDLVCNKLIRKQEGAGM